MIIIREISPLVTPLLDILLWLLIAVKIKSPSSLWSKGLISHWPHQSYLVSFLWHIPSSGGGDFSFHLKVLIFFPFEYLFLFLLPLCLLCPLRTSSALHISRKTSVFPLLFNFMALYCFIECIRILFNNLCN